jgi:hypothetical protein
MVFNRFDFAMPFHPTKQRRAFNLRREKRPDNMHGRRESKHQLERREVCDEEGEGMGE